MFVEIYFCSMGDRQKGQEIKKIETNTPWGKVLEILRVDKKNLSVNHFEKNSAMQRSEYRSLLGQVEGPTFSKMDRALRAMGCTWKDFAQLYEQMGFPPFEKSKARKASAAKHVVPKTKGPPKQKSVGAA